MSYLRLDNRETNYNSTIMTADGRTRNGSSMALTYARAPMPTSMTMGLPGMNMGMHQCHSQYPQLQQRQRQKAQAQAQAQAPVYTIRGINKLVKSIGYPDITDSERGGIAIWNSLTLRKRGYKFLHRVEIIDESVPSMYPVKHFSNVYIWVKVTLSETMINNVNQMSTDIFYDRGKDLLIVRSSTLDTAVAQAALIALYSRGKVSYYDIIGNNMLQTYYFNVSKPKARKTVYTILNNHTKH